MSTLFVLLFSLAATALAVPSTPTERPEPPRIVETRRQVANRYFHPPVDVNETIVPSDAQVWVIDYFHALSHPDIIPLSRKSPTPKDDNVVLCYVNVGAIEEFEADYADFPEDALGNEYDVYPEWWIDDWDQEGVDKTGWDLTQRDLIAYVEALAATAHSTTTVRGLPLMFGQKNANRLARDLVNMVDFVVLEDCQGLNGRIPGEHEAFCHNFWAFVTGANRTDGRALPVFEIEYPGSTEDGSEDLSAADWEYYCEREKNLVGNVDFSQIIKHESAQLYRWEQYF